MTTPKAPPNFDAQSKRAWKTVVTELQELGVWTAATAALAELYVQSLQVGRHARSRIARRLADDGEDAAYFSKGSMGQQVQSPDLATARQAESDAVALARELLLSPAARRRSRLGDDDDELAREIERALSSSKR